jgi:HEAT repeat protein
LRNRAIELDINDVEDSTTMSVVMQSVELPAARPLTPPAPPRTVPPLEAPLDSLQRLRAANAAAVRAELSSLTRWEPLVVPQVIRLLAWDEVSEAARQTLSGWGNRVTGQLTDNLLDDGQDFAIRRRIPRILARCGSQRAVDGLLGALEDPRFEIRFQASRALDYLGQHHPSLRYDPELLFATVSRELSVSRPIWEGRKLLDSRDTQDLNFNYLDEVLRGRANQSLEHVFSLLAVLLPREPLKTAFRALHSEDRLLRGLGLEYLATTLPGPVYGKLLDLVEQGAVQASHRTAEEVLAELMASGNSLVLELKKQALK